MGLYRNEKQPHVPPARGRHSTSNHSLHKKLKKPTKTNKKDINETGDRTLAVSEEKKRDILSEKKINQSKYTKNKEGKDEKIELNGRQKRLPVEDKTAIKRLKYQERTKHVKHAGKGTENKEKQINSNKQGNKMIPSLKNSEKTNVTEKERKGRYKLMKNEPQMKDAEKNQPSKNAAGKGRENIQSNGARKEVLYKDPNYIFKQAMKNKNGKMRSTTDRQESENSEVELSDEEDIQLAFGENNFYDEESHYGNSTAAHYRGHNEQHRFYNENAKNKRLKELAEIYAPYKVVLIPGDNPGVRWVTTLGLFFTTILLFTAWGSALYYILTPAINGTDIPETDFGKMLIR